MVILSMFGFLGGTLSLGCMCVWGSALFGSEWSARRAPPPPPPDAFVIIMEPDMRTVSLGVARNAPDGRRWAAAVARACRRVFSFAAQL